MEMANSSAGANEYRTPKKGVVPFLAPLTKIRAQHGIRGLIAIIALVGTSIGGYVLAYGLLIYLG